MRYLAIICLSMSLFHAPQVAAIGATFLGKDGDAYIVGTLVSSQGSRKGPFVVHLNADGSVDTDYGTYGVARPNYLADYDASLPMHFAVSPQGEVTASSVNCVLPGLLCTQYLARLDEQGQRDLTFGHQATPGFIALGQAPAIPGARLFAQGQQLVAYHVSAGQAGDYQLTRFTMNGGIDVSFGRQGHVSKLPGSLLTILRHGEIILSASDHGTHTTLLSRLLADGQSDPSFSDHAILPFPGAAAAIEQADGKLLVAALGSQSLRGSTRRVAIHRLHANGITDSSFGSNGTASLPGSDDDEVAAMAMQRGGKIVAFGVRRDAKGFGVMLLTRFTTDGQVDVSFGDHGLVTVSFPITAPRGTFAPLHVDTTKDDAIVAYGTVSIGEDRHIFGVVRFDRDGHLDETFGDQGLVLFDPLFLTELRLAP